MQEYCFHTFYQDLSLEMKSKLENIKLVVLDVDGSITRGGIYLDRDNNELKQFHCQDGMGIALLVKAGLEVAIITGRDSPLTARRASELKIQHVIQGQHNKEIAITKLRDQLGLKDENIAVLGDDINDIPLYKHAAVAACPKNGYHYMYQIANLKLTRKGGEGAAREFADTILMAKGLVRTDGYPTFLIDQKIVLDFTAQ